MNEQLQLTSFLSFTSKRLYVLPKHNQTVLKNVIAPKFYFYDQQLALQIAS